jgi:hypothetical protein
MNDYKISWGWLRDAYGNRVSIKKYGIKQAVEMLDSLEDCRKCTNCRDCVECTSCIDCTACKRCYLCESSTSCFGCRECESCHHCDSQERCKRCLRCRGYSGGVYSSLEGKYCMDCTDCEGCRGCVSCRNCKNCFRLKDADSYLDNEINKKFKLLREEKVVLGGKELFRIVAMRTFGDVKKWDKGGFIESEETLSHGGECWVYEGAAVFGGVRIEGDAKVYGKIETNL